MHLTGRFAGPDLRPQLEQLADTRGRFLQWTAWAILTWRPSTVPHVPVVHLHGTDDPVLPHHLTHPDILIPGGGHVLPISHAREVNAFLRSQMERYCRGDADAGTEGLGRPSKSE
jgi:pimeloyl-ACP methyl ester carboxylesterase